MIAAGTVLHDRYRIIRPIGEGGMGSVYEAVDTRLQNTVALKQLTLDGAEANHAFEREAKLLAQLRHPALPVVIDYFADRDAQFLVMQLIEGEDLSRRVQRLGGPSNAEVLEWADVVLDALSYLHGHAPPIVHRDIKPANLCLTPSGEIVLLDFGLAKGSLGATIAGGDRSVLGYTLWYAPLEQIQGRVTDPRSDIYALGATLYHLATGTAPPSALERFAAVRDGKPDPLPQAHLLTPTISEAFGRVLRRALALEPADRFESAREMRAALAGQGREEPTRRLPRAPVVASRRVDAAMPSQAEVGRQTDLIVQVRFEDSPRLGLEDWPTRRRPTQLEQSSEAVHVVHPVDTATGTPLPARLRLKLIAPDFSVAGQTEHLIEVPPDAYSKRLAFLLTPLHAGYCRLNVEVYGPDTLFLGAISVEAEAVATGLAQPILKVANLVLGVFASRVTPPAPQTGAAGADASVRNELSIQRQSPPAHRSWARRLTLAAPVALLAVGAGVVIRVGVMTPAQPPVSLPSAGEPSPSSAVAGSVSTPAQAPAAAAAPPPTAPAAAQPVDPPPPRAAVANPAPTAAPTPASSLATEEAGIREVLQRYRAGYEGLNPAEIKAVYPGLSDRALKDLAATFKQYTSLKQEIEIDRVEVMLDGQTAKVTAAVTNAPIAKTGNATRQRSQTEFLMKKSGDAWLIQAVNMR